MCFIAVTMVNITSTSMPIKALKWVRRLYTHKLHMKIIYTMLYQINVIVFEIFSGVLTHLAFGNIFNNHIDGEKKQQQTKYTKKDNNRSALIHFRL